MGLRRLSRGVVCGVVLGAMAASALVVGAPASANATFSFTRVAGADRFATAAQLAESAFPSGASVAFLANGTTAHFPDALTGAYAAGFVKGPVLLTDTDSLPSATASALQALHTTNVVILGGPAAISSAQETQLASSYKVTRLYNQDGCTTSCNRYDTSRSVAISIPVSHVGTIGGRPAAIVASGANFPDALVSGPLSYASGLPVLITDPASLSPQTSQTLKDLGIGFVLIPGGTAAVSAGVETQIQALGITTRRFSGQDRTDTAAQVAHFAVDNLGFTNKTVDLARGDDPADALAGGPYGGASMTPLLLTDDPNTLGAYSARYLTDLAPSLASGTIFGGTSAVSQAVQNQATTDAQNTAGPRLATASISTGSSTLTLTFTEAIVCSSLDANGSDFQVSVGSAADNPSAAACVSPTGGAAATVALTLPTAVPAGSTVAATAEAGGDGNTVLDAQGASEPVGDTVSTSTGVVPLFSGASSVVGSTSVTAVYQEAVQCSSVDTGDYSVTVGGAGDSVSSVSCPPGSSPSAGTTSNSVLITVATAPTSTAQTVSVTAQVGTDGNTVLDSAGMAQPVGNSASTSPTATTQPRIEAFTAGDATNAYVTYNESIVCSSVDANGSDYSVVDNTTADNPTAASCVSPSGGAAYQVELTLPTAPAKGDTVTVTVKSGADANTVTDAQGGAETVGDSAATTAIAPVFTGATVSAGSSTVTAVYSEAIVCSSVDPLDYTASGNLVTGAACPSTATGGQSNQVVITLANSVAGNASETITAQKGSDQNTVLDANGYSQPAGDTTTATAKVVPAMTAISATPGTNSVTVTYNETIVCSTVDANGSDYAVTSSTGSGSPTTYTVTGITSCSTSSPQTVTISLGQSVPSGQTMTVTAQNGSDGDTVKDSAGNQEAVGDHVSTSSGAASTTPTFTGLTQPSMDTLVATYNEAINTTSCDTTPAYDFTVSQLSSTPGSSASPLPIASVSCDNNGSYTPSGGTTQTGVGEAVITLTQDATSGDTITVTSQVGADSNTVCASGSTSNCQAAGQTETTAATTIVPKITSVTTSDGSNPATPQATITVTYNEDILCSTVDSGDYTVSYAPQSGGSASNYPAGSFVPSCSPSTGSSNQVLLSYQTAGVPFTPGYTITVTAQTGSDTNTVCTNPAAAPAPLGSPSNCEAAGDFGSTSSPNAAPVMTGVVLSSNTGANPVVTVTYSELITCSTVDTNGSDYTVVANPTTGSAIPTPATAASCVNPNSNGYSDQVTITTSDGPYQSGQTITVTAKNGGDGSTVVSPYSAQPEPVGDSKTSAAVT